MICNTKNFTMIVILLALLSCKKEESEEFDSDLVFTEQCDFSGSRTETVDRWKGILHYTDNLSGIKIPEPILFIKTQGYHIYLPMVICNMPADFEMAEGESREVTFSGRVVILPDVVDALSTWIELSYLKFEAVEKL